MDSYCSTPKDCDVLCGQSSLARNHPGNVFFRQLVLSKAEEYGRAKRKAQKGVIVSEILDEFERNRVRFMKFNHKENHWVAIPAIIAREKVSHAIRDRVRERKTKSKFATARTNNMTILDANSHVKVTRKLQPTSKQANLLVSPSHSEESHVMMYPCNVGTGGHESGNDASTFRATSSSHHLVSEDDNASFSSDASYNTSWLIPPSSSMQRPEFVSFSYSASTPLPLAGYQTTKLNGIAHLQQNPLDTMAMMDDASSVDIDDYNELMLSDIMPNNHNGVLLGGAADHRDETEFMIALLHAACSSMLCHYSDDGRPK